MQKTAMFISGVVVFLSCGRIGFESVDVGLNEIDTETVSYGDTIGDSDENSQTEQGNAVDSAGDTDSDPDSGSEGDSAPGVDSENNEDSERDDCPDDPEKTDPGVCGCGVTDTDSDGDGTLDCEDNCPLDPDKTAPGICGCGVTDIDDDGICEEWVLPGWSFRKPITIGSRAPVAVHSDFPILIAIHNEKSLADHARSDGHDIRFTTESGLALEQEIEFYDAGSGTLVSWVKLPTLDTGADTLLWLYYGNGKTGSDPSVASVWDNSYIAVWHLGETGSGVAGEFRDSSGEGNHARGGGGAKQQTPIRASGKIGYGQNGDGVDDYISTPFRFAGEAVFTLTAWFYGRSVKNTARPGLLGQDNSLEMGFYWTDRLNVWGPDVKTTCPGKSVVSLCTDDFSLNTWMHLAVVFDRVNATLYLNGVVKHVADFPNIGSSASYFNLMGRVFDGTGNSFDGLIDEVRLATTTRSAAWLATQYASQSDPASFYTVGPPQEVH